MVKNPPSKAVDAGSIPGRGTKIPHAAGQLSHAPQLLSPRALEPGAPQLERSPCAAMKIPYATTKTPRSQIIKKGRRSYVTLVLYFTLSTLTLLRKTGN